jgi:hypothetical protein
MPTAEAMSLGTYSICLNYITFLMAIAKLRDFWIFASLFAGFAARKSLFLRSIPQGCKLGPACIGGLQPEG